MNNSRICVLALTLLLTLTACQKPPQVELDAARAALGQASKLAETYAPEALADAETALQALDTEIAAQAEKFALVRNYDKALQLVAEVQSKAEAAGTQAAAAKAEAKAAAEGALASAEAAIVEANEVHEQLAACKKAPKGFAADLEALRAQLDGLAAEVEPIRQSLEQEDFLGAVSRGGALTDQVQALLTDMTRAKEKIAC